MKEQTICSWFGARRHLFYLNPACRKAFPCLLCGLNEVKPSYSEQRNHRRSPLLLWAAVNTEERLHGWKAFTILNRPWGGKVLRGVMWSNRPQECKSPTEPRVEPAGGLARSSDVRMLLGSGPWAAVRLGLLSTTGHTASQWMRKASSITGPSEHCGSASLYKEMGPVTFNHVGVFVSRSFRKYITLAFYGICFFGVSYLTKISMREGTCFLVPLGLFYTFEIFLLEGILESP